eukprot:gene7258-7662_t
MPPQPSSASGPTSEKHKHKHKHKHKRIQRSGNAGNSKKGSKDDVKQLQAKLKEQRQQHEKAGPVTGPSSSSCSTFESNDQEDGFAIWGSETNVARTSADSSMPPPVTVNYDLHRWTGKRPQTLLIELCQQRQYNKPQIRAIPKNNGFICKINRDKPLFSQLVAHLEFIKKPMESILPPIYRDYWKELEKKFAQNQRKNKHSSPLPVDPFERQKTFIPHIFAFISSGSVEKDIVISHNQEQRLRSRERSREFDPKLQFPSIAINDSTRQRIEAAVKRAGAYSRAHGQIDAVERLSMSSSANMVVSAEDIVVELKGKGFFENHIREALQYTSNSAAALEWLLLHVPERDLPLQYKPEIIDMKTHVHDTTALAREYTIRRILDYGFQRKHVDEVLAKGQRSEWDAIAYLLAELIFDCHINPQSSRASASQLIRLKSKPSDIYPWIRTPIGNRSFDPEIEKQLEEEFLSIQDIFDKQCNIEYSIDTDLPFRRLKLELSIEGIPGLVILEVVVPIGCQYPIHFPLIMVSTTQLPAYIGLALMKDANLHAYEFRGDVLINDVVIWLETSAITYFLSPPPLALLPANITSSMLETGALQESSSKMQPRKLASNHSVTKKIKHLHLNESFPTRSIRRDINKDKKLAEKEQTVQSRQEFCRMLKPRKKLPCYSFRSKIIEMIKNHPVVIIGGQTGCGKTTQIPQYVLESLLIEGSGSLCNIICTQPRRLSAVAVATRVSQERAQELGDDVGYKIRLKTRASSSTRLLFCTTGILLRHLQSDPALHTVSHVFVDEVHERSLDGDVLLARLRLLLQRRKDLKVVLMSATLDAERFSDYFGGAPVVAIPGFTHPVTEIYLEDIYSTLRPKLSLPGETVVEKMPSWVRTKVDGEDVSHLNSVMLSRLTAWDVLDFNLIALVVEHIVKSTKEGAILVFMPGMADINKTISAIVSRLADDITALPLHSSLSSSDQNKIFKKLPKHSRKVIVSTNIAETSITVDDVVFVIDAGKMNENRYDSSYGMELLVQSWISRASAQQRRGRAGRVSPGVCYRLYTRRRFNNMADQQDPEILRVPLEHLCLSIKSTGQCDVQQFLDSLLDAPKTSTVKNALVLLQEIGAIDSRESITALGLHLSQIPIEPRLGKLIIFGCILKCLDPILTIASFTGHKSVFFSPMDRLKEANAAKQKFSSCASDHIAIINAYNNAVDVLRREGRSAFVRFCNDHFLSHNTITDVIDLRKQYYQVLQEIGFAPPIDDKKLIVQLGTEELNIYSENRAVILAAVFAGLYPNAVRAVLPRATFKQVQGGAVREDPEAKGVKLFPKEPGRLFFHPSSVLFHETKFPSQFVVFSEKVKTSKVFIKNASLVSNFAALLFSGSIVTDYDHGLLIVDNWMKFRADARVGVLVSKLKTAFDVLLAVKFEAPLERLDKHEVFEVICQLLVGGQL